MDLNGQHKTLNSFNINELWCLVDVAEFERQRLRERTLDGLAKAAKEGRKGGRPIVADKAAIQKLKAEGISQSKVGVKLGISLSTVKRNWN